MVSLSTFFERKGVPVKKRPYPAGSRIFSQADLANEIYFLESGQVNITKKALLGQKEINLATLGPGDFFGVLSFTSGSTRLADATALTDCTLWEIDKKAFEEALDISPEFSMFFISDLAKRLESLNKRMLEISDGLREFTRRIEDLSTLWQSLIPM
ncbi:MAG TPA: Crp/Fnr family transcriptional regulator [Candidatus Hypogeohydataceae bacterium YC41]